MIEIFNFIHNPVLAPALGHHTMAHGALAHCFL